MLDVHAHKGEVVVYHASSALGRRPLQDDLGAIRAFLQGDARAVITLIFENHVPASSLRDALAAAGLDGYIHRQERGAAWPSLCDMVDAGHRLVVFCEQDSSLEAEGILYAWHYMTENHYANHRLEDFSTRYNRGDSTHRLYLMNNFLTHRHLGYGLARRAAEANALAQIVGRARRLQATLGRLPHFVAVDFVEVGDAKAAVDSIQALWRMQAAR